MFIAASAISCGIKKVFCSGEILSLKITALTCAKDDKIQPKTPV